MLSKAPELRPLVLQVSELCAFVLQVPEELFGHGVVVTVARSPHRTGDAECSQRLLVRLAGIPHAVAVMQKL
jgi:hypothetical protein